MNGEIKKLQQALRIPREHYKLRKNFKFEEMLAQGEQILRKFKRGMNVEMTEEALKLISGPSPNEEPEELLK